MIRRVVRGIGKTLISVGVLILLFVVYQLWGTGLTHDRGQKNLRSQFAKQLAAPAAADPVYAAVDHHGRDAPPRWRPRHWSRATPPV